MSDERGTSDDSTRFAAGRGGDDETRFTGVGAPPPGGGPAHTTFPPGSLIGHTYRIEALLARGGMGEVYRARHAELNTDHALKIILPELANNQRIVDLFRREASVLRTIRHDAVVAYDGVSRDENGRLYLVMEFVDGPSLSKLMGNRTFTAEEVRQLRDRLADGLAVAHDKGVIHRDISPDNVILPGGDVGKAKIIDFGISKMADPEQKTIVGDDFAGKFSYVSPEQLGMFGGKVDGRSDIYSLGLVLAAAAQGEPLDMGQSPISVIEARRAVPDLSRVPAAVRADLAAMLQPDPAKRPQSMHEMARPLDQRGGRSTLSDSTRRSLATKAGAGRMGAILGALAVVVVAAGAGGVWYWQNRNQHDDTTTAQQDDSSAQQNGTTEASNAGAADTASTTGQAVQQSTTSTDAGQAQSTTAGTSAQDTGAGAAATQQQTSTGTASSSGATTATDNQQEGGSNSTTSSASDSGSSATNQDTTTTATTIGNSDAQSQSQQTNGSASVAATETSQPSDGTAGAETIGQQTTELQSSGTTTVGGQQSSSNAVTTGTSDQSGATTATSGTTTSSTATTQTVDGAASNGSTAASDSAASAAGTGTQTALLPQVPDVAKLRSQAQDVVGRLGCAGVVAAVSDRGDIVTSGYVANETDRTKLFADLKALPQVGRVDNTVAVMKWPICHALDVVREGTAFNVATAPRIDPGGVDGVYRENDNLKVTVTAMSDGYLYVDYVDFKNDPSYVPKPGEPDEYIIHLLPNDAWRTEERRVKAGEKVVIGTLEDELKNYTMGPPFGAYAFIAICSPERLFERPRPVLEQAEDYLPVLRDRLAAVGRRVGREKLPAASTIVVVQPRQ